MKIKVAVSGLLSLLLIPASQCFAQAATISDCQNIQDRLARYACYDKWDSASGVVRQSVPARTATTRAQEGEDETSLFGRVFNRDSDEEEQAAEVATQSAPATADTFGRQQQSNARLVDGELIDTVAALEQRGPSLWLVTLSSGQQWRQMISKRYPLEVGDEVRVYSTRWGNSFRMASEKAGGYIQVERADNGGAVAVNAPAPAPAAPAAEPAAQEESDEPGLLGRVGGAIGGVGSRIGGIFTRDSEAEEEEATPQVASESAAPAAAATAVGDFGRASASGSSARVVDGELIDTIASLQQAGPSLWLVTLEGGQQWKQMISKRYTLEVGDEVRIYPTRWGNSFRLSSERAGGYIQVQRVD
jgi:hypothetical protein